MVLSTVELVVEGRQAQSVTGTVAVDNQDSREVDSPDHRQEAGGLQNRRTST